MSIKFSNYFFLLAVFCLALSFSVKAQNSSACGKGYTYEYVSYLEYESELEMQYNSAKGTYEYVPVSKWKMKWRWECVPITTETKPTNTNTPKSESTNTNAPKGKFEKVWVDHSVFEDKKKGMRIHAAFDVSNLKGKKCRANVYFYFASGKALKDLNNKFNTTDGNVAMNEEFSPPYENSTYKDFQLFMPYDELHMEAGKSSLKLVVKLSCEGLGFLAESEDYEFDYTRPK